MLWRSSSHVPASRVRGARDEVVSEEDTVQGVLIDRFVVWEDSIRATPSFLPSVSYADVVTSTQNVPRYNGCRRNSYRVCVLCEIFLKDS